MIQRTIKKEIVDSIKNRPVTLIIGARQVGKSTLCKELVKEFNYNYVSLDNLRERQSAIEDPEMFLELHKWPLIIDEVQHAPKLFEVIEQIVNQEKFINDKNYGMFVLTGSQSYKLISNASESMAGRVSIIHVSPLSMSEINKKEELPFFIDIKKMTDRINSYKIDVDALYQTIVKGFYPELYDNPSLDSSKFYADYVASYLEKDVSSLIQLNDKLKFQNFMEVLASLTGQELVYDSIAKAVGVSLKTVQAWISVLVTGDIIHLLQPYNDTSILKRVTKRPKLYFKDTGLACYLARLNNPDTLKHSIFNGRFVETYIVNEIMKSYQNNGKYPGIFYYRDTKQNEIDLVIIDGGIMHLVEAKSGVSFSKNDIKAFNIMKKSNYQLGLSCVICNTKEIYVIDRGVYALPISSI